MFKLNKTDVEQLRYATKSQHGGKATLAQSILVTKTHSGTVVWDDVVQVFDLAGHPTASRAYACSVLCGKMRRGRQSLQTRAAR